MRNESWIKVDRKIWQKFLEHLIKEDKSFYSGIFSYNIDMFAPHIKIIFEENTEKISNNENIYVPK